MHATEPNRDLRVLEQYVLAATSIIAASERSFCATAAALESARLILGEIRGSPAVARR